MSQELHLVEEQHAVGPSPHWLRQLAALLFKGRGALLVQGLGQLTDLRVGFRGLSTKGVRLRSFTSSAPVEVL